MLGWDDCLYLGKVTLRSAQASMARCVNVRRQKDPAAYKGQEAYELGRAVREKVILRI